MAKIIGDTTATPNPRPDWNQTDETKADYIKNKPDVANAIKETVSGAAVTMTDVSPLEHNIKVKLSAKQEMIGQITNLDNGWWDNYPNYGDYVVDHIDYEDTNGEGKVVFTDGSSLDCGMCIDVSILDIIEGDTVRMDYDREYDDQEYWYAYLLKVGEVFRDSVTELCCLTDNSYSEDFREGYGDYTVLSVERGDGDTVFLVFTDGSSCSYWDVRDNYHLIEIGSVIRYYLKPFEGDYIGLLKKGKSMTDVTLTARGKDSNGVDVVKQYTPGTDGYVNVTSLYPTIELTTDTEDIIIEAEYNLDLNKASFGGCGSGEDGATFTPSVSSDGVISWTNDKGLSNPASVNIKGDKGEKGEPDYSLVANALKGTVSGEAVSIADVSPLEHSIGVKLKSDTITDFSSVTLKKCGKNLLDLTSLIGKSVTLNGGTLSCGADGGISGSGTLSGYVGFDPFRLYLPKGKYILSASGTFSNFGCYLTFRDENNVNLGDGVANRPGGDFVFNTENYPSYSYVEVTIKRNNNVALSGTAYFQIELGSGTATEYEYFKEPETYNGTVESVPSLYPVTTLMTDTDGVIINAEYNKDTNKVIERLVNAIISLGGNV